MFKSGTNITTDLELQAAMYNRSPLQAVQEGDALHHGGPIESITETSIKIDVQYFMRTVCTFIIR